MIKKIFKAKDLALLLAVSLGTSGLALAQDHLVSEYTFSQEMGTYEPLDAPTYIVETTAETTDVEDSAVYTLPENTIPFTFNFNGTDYNTLNVYPDGFITFGSYAADGTGWYHYKPITNPAPFEGIVAGFNDDLIPLKLVAENKFGKLSYQVKGQSPNRSFVIQWENYARARWQDDYETNRYECNFQIILNEDNTIEYKYDISAFGFTEEEYRFITTGLRGNSTADFNTRKADGTNQRWDTTIQGNQAASTVLLDAISVNLPASGLTYKWTPPTNNQNPPTTTYCTPTFQYPSSGAEPITFVGFNTIANTTSAVYADLLPHYEDFSSISTEVTKGETYELKLKGNTIPTQVGNTNYFAVFIDWNQDGTFNTDVDGGEYYNNLPELSNSNGTDDVAITYNIQIPTTAANGNVRMRIIKNYSEVPTEACGVVGDYGQVEDYTLVVQDAGSGIGCTNTDPGDTAGDTGCISGTYNGTQVEYTTVRAADGNIWLQQNLGSTQVALSFNDEASYGDLFQWGRWDDGHQLRNSTVNTASVPSPNNPLGVVNGSSDFYINWWADDHDDFDTWEATSVETSTDTDGCDPCKKALGEAWELPSQQDWVNLKTAENISNKTAAFESNLKLPASGYRTYYTNGELNYVGERGYYWSKTATETGAKYFYISDAVSNPNAGGNVAQGIAVRCLKKATNASNEQFDLTDVTIYPNPVSDRLYIDTDETIKTVELYDVNGKRLMQTKSVKSVDVSSLNTGVYLLKVVLGNGNTSTKKFIKK